MQILTKLAAFSLCVVMTAACTPDIDADFDTPRGALLYDLSDAEVEQIHANYAANEDLDLFRARLAAPFDCSLYGQFCEQVGPDAAASITGEMVDFALDGAPQEDIQAHLDARIDEAVALADGAETGSEDSFRGAGSWATQTYGDYRLRVRNGITTPLFGDRQAWTEARSQKKIFGIWSSTAAPQLCVNAGTNYQWRFDYFPGDYYTLLESINPTNACQSSVSSRTVKTYHARLSINDFGNNPPDYLVVEAHGCASANLNGHNFKLCAPLRNEHFY